VRQRRARQVDLFGKVEPPQAMPLAIEQEVFALLVQLLQIMLPAVEAEVLDEQDLD
jgi:hypothetical protein